MKLAFASSGWRHDVEAILVDGWLAATFDAFDSLNEALPWLEAHRVGGARV